MTIAVAIKFFNIQGSKDPEECFIDERREKMNCVILAVTSSYFSCKTTTPCCRSNTTLKFIQLWYQGWNIHYNNWPGSIYRKKQSEATSRR